MSAHSPLLPSVVTAPWQVDQALRTLGITREIVEAVAHAAAGAKADTLSVDPMGAPGTLAYIHGVRAIRLMLLPEGWRVARDGNVEATVNHTLGVQLLFQNVDRACGDEDPQAISGKGPASRDLIRHGTMGLFESYAPRLQSGQRPTVWMICVSSDENGVRVEVSCPSAFEGDQFDGFVHRIFVLDESTKSGPTPRNDSKDDDDDLDLDIPVSKKK